MSEDSREPIKVGNDFFSAPFSLTIVLQVSTIKLRMAEK